VSAERARRILYRLDPLIRLDGGPKVIDLVRIPEVGELCTHAHGYHVDPYGILFRTDLRLARVVDLVGWANIETMAEVRDLLNRTIEMIKENEL
jgi:hypothetical protein